MKLIVGGAYQGKLNAAFGLLGEGEDLSLVADGRTAPFEEAFDKKIVYNLHEYIKRFCQEEESEDRIAAQVQKFLEKLVQKNSQAIVVCNELGCGIVPLSRTDRLWRESTGDACQYLAGEAEEVCRVICGLIQPLKGGSL